jgi:hypothetical protein
MQRHRIKGIGKRATNKETEPDFYAMKTSVPKSDETNGVSPAYKQAKHKLKANRVREASNLSLYQLADLVAAGSSSPLFRTSALVSTLSYSPVCMPYTLMDDYTQPFDVHGSSSVGSESVVSQTVDVNDGNSVASESVVVAQETQSHSAQPRDYVVTPTPQNGDEVFFEGRKFRYLELNE